MNWWPFLRKSEIEVYILKALKPGEQYGNELWHSIHSLSGKRVSLGRLLSTLYGLEQRGVIVSRWGEATPERGWARRRYYRRAV